MLHIKYPSFTPSSFKQEEFWSFHSLFLCSNLWFPLMGQILSQRASYDRTWQRCTRKCYIPNIKVPCLSVSERKNFEVGLPCSYVPSCDPWGRANFDPKGIIWTKLVEVHKEMLYTKYQSCRPSSFREVEFWSLPSLFLCSNLWHPGRGQFWSQGYHLNKLGRGSLEDATHQISKLYII